MYLTTPMKVGFVLFAVCLLLGLKMSDILIIVSVHYIAHQLL